MREARKEAQLAVAVRKFKDEKDRAALETKAKGEQARVDDIVMHNIDSWKHFEGTVQHCPASVDTVDVTFPARELAGQALKSMQGRPRKHATLMKKLEADWECKHALICHDAVPSIDGATNLSGGTCWADGFCKCSEESKKVKQLKAAWSLLALAPNIRPGSVGRTLVTNGFFICRVESLEWIGDSDDVPDPLAEFWHVSLMYLSPMRPTFTKLSLLEEQDDGSIVLETTDRSMSYLEAFAGMDRRRLWEHTWYALDDTSRPLPSINASRLYARPWDGAETTCFWPPPRKPRAPRARRPRPAALLDADMLEDMGDDGALDDEDMGDDGADGPDEGAEEDAGADEMDVAAAEMVAGGDGADVDELMHFLDVLDEAEAEARAPPLLPEPRTDGPPGPMAPAAAASPIGSGPSSSNSSSSSDSESEVEGDRAAGDGAVEPAAAPLAPPAPPMAAAAPIVRGPAGARRRADIDVEIMPPHRLAYYSSNGDFVAQCRLHDKCFKTRTSRASAKGKGPQGRPAGHLAAWLSGAEAFPDKASRFAYKPRLEDRREVRAILLEMPSAVPLFAYERDRRGDEDSDEPAELA
jgi:hypothetical protein